MTVMDDTLLTVASVWLDEAARNIEYGQTMSTSSMADWFRGLAAGRRTDAQTLIDLVHQLQSSPDSAAPPANVEAIAIRIAREADLLRQVREMCRDTSSDSASPNARLTASWFRGGVIAAAQTLGLTSLEAALRQIPDPLIATN